MSTQVANPGTERQDTWWLEPLLVFLGLTAFIIYATGRAVMGFVYDGGLEQFFASHQEYAQALGFAYYGTSKAAAVMDGWRPHYISPIASPDLSLFLRPLAEPVSELVRQRPGWEMFVISPALWILWAPGGFRVTCYYYRKAYYRSFFQNPTACAVAPSPKNPLGWLLGFWNGYRGEKSFPLIFQNLHRYFLYIALGFLLFLGLDALISFFFVRVQNGEALHDGPFFGHYFGIKVGSIVLLLNFVFLSLYTFSCHSWRHLIGGYVDNFSGCGLVGMAKNHAWQRQSLLNEHHMLFAWISLFWVGFTDFYIWQVALGNIPDITLLSSTQISQGIQWLQGFNT